MPRQDTHPNPARRRYAAAFKSELVERSLQPGASVSAIALENGMNANVLFKWRREHLCALSTVQGRGAAHAMLLPVELATTGTPSSPLAMSSRPIVSEGVIEIDIGAVRVRLRGCVDESNLRCVLDALRAAA
jgi:transposase